MKTMTAGTTGIVSILLIIVLLALSVTSVYAGSAFRGRSVQNEENLELLADAETININWRRLQVLAEDTCHVEGVEGVSGDGVYCCPLGCGQCGGTGCGSLDESLIFRDPERELPAGAGTSSYCCLSAFDSSTAVCGDLGVEPPALSPKERLAHRLRLRMVVMPSTALLLPMALLPMALMAVWVVPGTAQPTPGGNMTVTRALSLLLRPLVLYVAGHHGARRLTDYYADHVSTVEEGEF